MLGYAALGGLIRSRRRRRGSLGAAVGSTRAELPAQCTCVTAPQQSCDKRVLFRFSAPLDRGVVAKQGPIEVRLHKQVKAWYDGLSHRDAGQVAAAFDHLADVGSTLKRPLVDRIKGSQFHKMKELRPPGGHKRILFAFDGDGRAIMLAAGDKTGNWKGWYRENIKVADERLKQHNVDCGGEYRWHPTGQRTGNRSADRGR